MTEKQSNLYPVVMYSNFYKVCEMCLEMKSETNLPSEKMN